MWFYAVCLVIFVISLLAVLAIVYGKFGQVSLIDTDTLPQERDRRKKRQIISERVRRLTAAGLAIAGAWSRDRAEAMRREYAALVSRLQELERQYGPKLTITPAAVREQALKLSAAGLEHEQAGRWAEAEKSYLEMAKLNVRNVTAYRGLARVYAGLKQWPQAKETLQFLIKLAARGGCGHARAAVGLKIGVRGLACSATQAEHAELAADYLSLAVTCREMGDTDCARRAYAGALVFEPANPKYLDLFLEACILVGDKGGALAAFTKLKEANPENQKLRALFEKINSLVSK